MRKRRVLISILLLTLFLCGCATYGEENNNLDTYVFSPYFKPDVLAEDGKKAALSDGRVFYLSAESGEQGLHSMAVDGSDVRLEFATEDIRSLTVRDDTIWTAEFVGMDENVCGPFRAFRLFVRRDGADGKAIDILNTVDEEVRDEEIYWEENVWDFYVTEEVLFFRVPRHSLPSGDVLLHEVSLRKDGTLTGSFYSTGERKVISEHLDLEKPFDRYEISICNLNHCVILDEGCIYDFLENRPAFVLESRFVKARYFLNIVYADEARLYINESKMLQWLSTDPVNLGVVTAFDDEEKIYAGYHTDDTHLLLTRKNVEKERFLRPNKLIRSDKTLYRLDLETGEREQLLTLELPADFVYLDENYAATAEGKTLTLYDIRGETAQQIRKIELGHKIVDKANKTDAAGGWWFLYCFNEETNRDELIEKVRLY